MNATSPKLPPEVHAALRAAVAYYGVKAARMEISLAWSQGYPSGLRDHSSALQRWRNSPNGRKELAKVRMSDFKAAPVAGKPFALDVNLDDWEECEQFLADYEPARGLHLASKLGFQGKGQKAAANALMNYAQNKRAAVGCRNSGNIQTALSYEAICDRIYKEDIQPFVACW